MLRQELIKFSRIVALLMVVFAVARSAFAGPEDFVEAQMKYRVLENGKKDFTYTWDAEEKTLQIRLGLTWDNYDPAIHAVGFNLRKVAEMDWIFPTAIENCSFYKAWGAIPGASDLENNEVFIEFKGDACIPDMLDLFKLASLAVHFYNVQTMDGADMTGVLRLQLYEAGF